MVFIFFVVGKEIFQKERFIANSYKYQREDLKRAHTEETLSCSKRDQIFLNSFFEKPSPSRWVFQSSNWKKEPKIIDYNWKSVKRYQIFRLSIKDPLDDANSKNLGNNETYVGLYANAQSFGEIKALKWDFSAISSQLFFVFLLSYISLLNNSVNLGK